MSSSQFFADHSGLHIYLSAIPASNGALSMGKVCLLQKHRPWRQLSFFHTKSTVHSIPLPRGCSTCPTCMVMSNKKQTMKWQIHLMKGLDKLSSHPAVHEHTASRILPPFCVATQEVYASFVFCEALTTPLSTMVPGSGTATVMLCTFPEDKCCCGLINRLIY